MANEHIGRLQAIGIGKESVAGTPVAATAWLPKKGGSIQPSFESAVDDSAYGVIDEVVESETVKNITEVNLPGIMRDDWLGLLLLAALGTHDTVYCATITGQSGGTPARGDIVTSATGTWQGTIKKIIVVGATTYCFLTEDSGTLSDQTDATNGTWSGGTITFSTFAAVKGHFFSRLNTNAHPTFTMYGHDPVGDEYSSYAMLDTLDLEFAVGEYGMFTSAWKGKQLVSTTLQDPGYTTENPFLTKHAALKFADDEPSLNAAPAVPAQRVKLTISKNLAEIMNLGSDDLSSIHNQQFNIAGDVDIFYNSTDYRDYVADSVKKAARIQAINDKVTALYDDGANSIYPSLYIDAASLSFTTWTRSEDLNGLVSQTMGFSGEYSRSLGMTIEILFLNDYATAY